MASTAIRERRRALRYRNLLVRQMVQMKNKISGLLMEAGVSYNKHGYTKRVIFASCWRRTRISTKDYVRCCARVAKTVVRLQKTESAIPCCWTVWSG